VRGPETAATLARVGVAAEILGDPVCWFGQPREFWQPTEKVMGLNVGHSYGHMYGAEAEIQKKLADFARTMRQRGWTIEFYCVWPDDLGVIHRVAAEAGIANPVIHCIYDDARAYLERVRRLQFFVGIKLHAVALAMCANTPSVMLEYRPKCREFMSSLGMERFAFRSDRFAVEDLLAAADEFEHRSGAIADAIVSGMAPIRSRLQGLGDRIAKLESTNA
jgi:polysaccharide pyruvyl transferase WcaK-like protein